MPAGTAEERDRLLDEKVRAAEDRADRIERAKRLKEEAERRSNAQPSSFANRRAQQWSNR